MLQLKNQMEKLPSVMREVAEVVGIAEVEVLIGAFGGTSLSIPATQQSRVVGRLQDKLGSALVHKLICNFAGTRIYIPKCEKIILQNRDKLLNQERDVLAKSGVSERAIVTTLALKYDICDRHVWRILKKPMDY